MHHIKIEDLKNLVFFKKKRLKSWAYKVEPREKKLALELFKVLIHIHYQFVET